MNDINYQRELDKLIEANEKEGALPRLLIHSCCAPCSSYVLEYLSGHFSISLFFYNPNIDTFDEYVKRAAELERLAASMQNGSVIPVITADYSPDDFLAICNGHENDPERGERCLLCYELRLRKTAEYMLSMNEVSGGRFDYFATTLTLSPLKDAKAINSIGARVAGLTGMPYLNTDFKKKNGYKRSIELSKEYGLYRQDYCGCRFSKRKPTMISEDK